MRANTWTISFLVYILLMTQQSIGQTADSQDYEEVMVYLRVQTVGGFDVNALYHYEHEKLYLPVAELFTFLKINQQASEFNEVISGFFIEESNLYEINHKIQQIRVGGKTIPLARDEILRTETGLFLWTGIFGKAFGLHTSFNFRAMTVDMKTDLELPAIREMRLQQLRKNLEQLRGEIPVDTTIRRAYHLFRIGMVDWALSSTQITNKTTDNRLALGIGMELLAGETNLYFNHSTRDGFNVRNQQYQWRFVTNENPFIRQVRAGKIGAGSIASIFDPMHGVTITNATTSFRRSFGEYTLTDFTEPGWTVELYVNNVMIAYQVADASGYFRFDVPLVYGASQVMLKFYGPYGEERIREQFINIPYNFLPRGELEYHLTSGIVSDSTNSLFAKASVFYGVNRFLTIGGGLEHLSSITTGSEIPFGNLSLAPFRNLLFTGEYAHGVRTKALLSYRLPTNLVVELEHATYDSEQRAIRYNYLEERKASINIPLRSKFLRGSARLTYKQNVYEMLNYNTADATFSTSFGPVSSHIAAYATWISERDPYLYSNLTLGIRLKYAMLIRPQVQYDITNREIVSFKLDFEKRIKQSGHIAVSYQDNILADYRSIEVAFRWDLPYAQVNSALRVSNFDLTTTQGARGGMAFDDKITYLHTDNRSSIGRGGLTIVPYLDINHNNIRDENEPLAMGLNVKINGGRMLRKVEDSLIRILELEPYTGYLIELDDASLENISWKLNSKVLRIHIDPNQFKHIEIPIQPGGEINGMITLRDENRSRGLSRVMVNVFAMDGKLVTRVMSESDGYITYLGLAPGSYFAQVDQEQMRRVGMTASPEKIDFEILPMAIGDIVDGLDFELAKEPMPEPTADQGQDQDQDQDQDRGQGQDQDQEQGMQKLEQRDSIQKSGAFSSPGDTLPEKMVADIPVDTLIVPSDHNLKGVVQDTSVLLERPQQVTTLTDTTPFTQPIIDEPAKQTGIVTDKYTSDTLIDKSIIEKPISTPDRLLTPEGEFREIAETKVGATKDETEDRKTTISAASAVPTTTDSSSLALGSVPSQTSEDKTLGQFTPEGFNPLAGDHYVQAGAFRSSVNAAQALEQYEKITGKEGALVLEQGFYKIRFGQFHNATEASPIRRKLESKGIKTVSGVHRYDGEHIQSDTIQTLQEALRIARILGGDGDAEILVTQTGHYYIVRAGFTTDQETMQRLKNLAIQNPQSFNLPLEAPLIPADANVQTSLQKKQHHEEPILVQATGDIGLQFSPGNGPWFVQAGAFVFPANAARQLMKYRNTIPDLQGIVYENGFFNVRFGYFKTEEEAIACQKRLREAGFKSLRGTRNHGTHYFEIQSFQNAEKALHEARGLSKQLQCVMVVVQDGGTFVVRGGYDQSIDKVHQYRKILSGDGYQVSIYSATQ